jgi:hypothetical protein
MAGPAEGESKWIDKRAAANAAGRRSIEESVQKMAELRADYGAAEAKQKLLAAGFTPDRAEWLMQRSRELKAAQLQFARENQGKPISQREMQNLIDQDLPLRDEIGDAEYAKYRQATGRPMGTAITDVVPDSNAASVGLKPGDEIVQYGGKHVYSYFDLMNMVSENKSGGPTFLEVRRDGQTFQVLLPPGDLGIKPESFFSAMDRSNSFPTMEKLKSDEKSAMEKIGARAQH